MFVFNAFIVLDKDNKFIGVAPDCKTAIEYFLPQYARTDIVSEIHNTGKYTSPIIVYSFPNGARLEWYNIPTSAEICEMRKKFGI